MKEILDSVEPVVKQSGDVHINERAIVEFCQGIAAKDLAGSEYNDDTVIKGATEEDLTGFSLLYNTVNFCYWGEPKWTVMIDGVGFDGSAGMLRILKKAADNYPIFDPKYLAGLPEKDLQMILLGNVEIPLFRERLQLIRDFGRGVIEKFSGSFTAILDQGEDDAVGITKVLAEGFPTVFNDVVNYQGNAVKFHKRAQLAAAHLGDLSRLGLISRKITNLDGLTAFADYKVPQLLRKFGILEYSPNLAEKIDNKQEIPAGSAEEIEIRANTIWAVELATQEIGKKLPQATAALVDGIFWFKGQVKSPNDKPYHKTRTIWY